MNGAEIFGIVAGVLIFLILGAAALVYYLVLSSAKKGFSFVLSGRDMKNRKQSRKQRKTA